MKSPFDAAAQLITDGQHHRALISMWVAARRFLTLNDWEQACSGADGEAALKARTSEIRDRLDRESPLPEEANVFDPLALLVALDEFLFENEWGQRSHRTVPLEVDGNAYWLTKAPLATRPSGSLARQAANLTRWLKHHTVIPARVDDQFDIVLSRSHSHADIVLLKIATAAEPQVEAFIAHFDDGADVKWDRAPAGGNWTTLHIHAAEERAASIQRQLARAFQGKATFWLAPEFTIDPALRQVCRDTLEAEATDDLALIVPASFHETVGDRRWNIRRCGMGWERSCFSTASSNSLETLNMARRPSRWGQRYTSSTPPSVSSRSAFAKTS